MYNISHATEYFYNHLIIHPQDQCPSLKVFNVLKGYFAFHLNIPKDSFTLNAQLKDLLPLKDRKQSWKNPKKRIGYKFPEINIVNTKPDINLFGVTILKRKTPFTEFTIKKLIDIICSLNYSKILNLPIVTSRYEIERVIIGITSDKCGLPVEEIEPYHSFSDDLGID